MKRRLLFLTVFLCLFNCNRVWGGEVDDILKKVVPTFTIAKVNENCIIREKGNLLSQKIENLAKGAVVEILKDKNETWYLVQIDDENISGWVQGKYLDIEEAASPTLPEMTEHEIEVFANLLSFPSNTAYFIWTDIARQKTNILKKNNGEYKLTNTFICCSGKNTSPTTRGFYTISDRGKWFYSKRFASGAMYWVKFNDSYLFHSLTMDKNKKIMDSTLGKRHSNGCIRHSLADAKWIYENIPNGTTVFIH